jgi:hypothetical protein
MRQVQLQRLAGQIESAADQHACWIGAARNGAQRILQTRPGRAMALEAAMIASTSRFVSAFNARIIAATWRVSAE